MRMSAPLSNEPTTAVSENSTVNHPASLTQTPYRQSQFHARTQSYPLPEAEYEEIARNAELFFEKLQAFHRTFGTKFKVPTLGGKALDLHRLFLEVIFRGGIEKVIRDRKWKEIIAVFNFPSTITSASFVLRKYYLSLLYHFEQVYYFRKKVPSILAADSVSRIVNGSASLHGLMDGAGMKQFSDQASPNFEAGSSVTGTIDAKFDNGYIVTVNLGSEKLKGVLYHTPKALHMSPNSNTSTAPAHRNRKRLKPSYHGQEKAFSKKIRVLWSRLPEEERQVYEEQGLRDEERNRIEMSEYSSPIHLQAQ